MKTTSGSKDSTRDNRTNANGPSSEENSVAFSLSALMAQGDQAPKPLIGMTNKEDSGLIDLNALIAMEDSVTKKGAAPTVPAVSAHIGLFPFDAPPVTAAPAPVAAPVAAVSDDIEMPKKPSRALVWVGLVGVAVAAAAAFFVAMNGGSSDTPEVAQNTTTEAAPPAAPAPIETAKPVEEPKVAAADPGASKAKDKEPTKPAAQTTPAVAKPAAVAAAKPAAAKPQDAPAPAAKPAGASNDPCHGDLMCAMQRATKK